MKKLFFFFAAMLVAITVNATTWNITNSDEGNLRRCLRDNAQAGDTVVLADGVYAEDQSYNIRKAVVIMAADGAKPVINQKSYLNLYASAKIIGIKFKYVGTSDGYCIYFRENSEKYLALEGCEFQDFTNYAFTSWDKFHIDSCIVNNCYFHDFAKGAFYFPKSTLANDTNACDKLKVTNSTFANITLSDVAVLDLRNNNNNAKATSELTVDHCTFYKCRGYERMIQTYKTPKGSVTNCIMMNPLDADTVSPTYATYLYGGEVKNCLTYQTKGHRDWDTHPTITNCSDADPLFVNAAEGNYTLGEGSPALTAGTDGKAIGDPRWHPSVATYHDFEIDLRSGQLGTEGSNLQKYLAIDGETYNYSDAAPKEYNAILNAASYNGSQHGYVNLVATIPVEAGNYKLTLGACGYGSGAGTVKNADLSETLASFNQQIEANNKCYHQNTTENIVTATFKVSAAQTIRITCGNYTPYIKLEKLEAQEFTVTFAAEGAEGSIPAARNVVDGEKLTLPVNRTLYKDGYTLTGWSDGENTYSTEFTPTANVTLTAVFTANAKGLLNAQTETIVKWYFGESNGCPTMHLEGGAGNGFVVAQATVDGESQDVKLAIDATSGKFYNKNRGDKWAQVNANTVFTFPSKKDITVVIEANSGAADYTLDGGTLTANANDYYSYLQVTYPKSQATAIDNTNANAKAVKSIVNGQLLITRDGKTYNVLGTMVK